MMKRGDIYWVDLNPTIGSEIKKKRPCVLMGATPIKFTGTRKIKF
jgi:mRNA interferase MazF